MVVLAVQERRVHTLLDQVMADKKDVQRGKKRKSDDTGDSSPGTSPKIAKNYLANGSEMDVISEGNKFIVESEAKEIPTMRENHLDRSKMKGTSKNNITKFIHKVPKLQKEPEKHQASAAEAEETGNDLGQQSGGSGAALGKKLSDSENTIHVNLRSLAKRRKIDHPFEKTDLVSTMRGVVEKEFKESGEFSFFKEGTKLNENQSFSQNGIETGDEIKVGTEETVKSGNASTGLRST